jgi:uncharacterized damage-inducible protein DinB
MFVHLAVLTILILQFTPVAYTQEGSDITGFRKEFLGMFGREGGHVVQLADAMPQDTYSWRPAEGVRSVGEVYAHIAGTNLMFASVIAGEEFDFKGMEAAEKKERTKEEAKKELEASIEKVKGVATRMSDADLEKMITLPFLPAPMSARAILMITLSHISEHLGQSIAYARTNKIVPPWTAAENSGGN